MVSKISPRTRRVAAAIGGRIRALREAAEVSQETVARKIAMTRANFARIEQGRTNVTIDSLVRIADGLGVDVRELFEIEPAKPPKRKPRRP